MSLGAASSKRKLRAGRLTRLSVIDSSLLRYPDHATPHPEKSDRPCQRKTLPTNRTRQGEKEPSGRRPHWATPGGCSIDSAWHLRQHSLYMQYATRHI